VINSEHIESRQFIENTREIVLERVRKVIQRLNNIKINTVFNDELWQVINARIKVLAQEIVNSFARPICKNDTSRASSSSPS